VITSDEPWGKIWHTQLHYAHVLSHDHKVVFLGPPDPWGPTRMLKRKPEVHKVNDNLSVVHYFNFLPPSLGEKAHRVNDAMNEKFVRKLLRHAGCQHDIIAWKFDPFRGLYMFEKGASIIYHVIDAYNNLQRDPLYARQADVIAVTSPKLVGHYASNHSNVINIPQGINPDEFNTDPTKVAEYGSKYGKYYIVTGTISSESSIKLMNRLTDNIKGYNLVIVGPAAFENNDDEAEFELLTKKENVFYTGPVHGLELKNYIAAASACIIPYKFPDEKKLNVRSPLKALNYIAQNKPVISSIDCELPSLNGHAVYQPFSHEEFESMLRKALSGDIGSDKVKTEAYLKSVSYITLIHKILHQLETVKNKVK
jgi:hypothetical protein